MAETNQANKVDDAPVRDEDPITELSDIMKFDPVDAAVEKADAELQIDLENELMGELAVVEDEPVIEAEAVIVEEATDRDGQSASEPAQADDGEPLPFIPLKGGSSPVEAEVIVEEPPEIEAEATAETTGAEAVPETPEVPEVEAVAQEGVDGLDEGFDAIFSDSLDKPDDAAPTEVPSVPEDLESQLNQLLAGLGDQDEPTETQKTPVDDALWNEADPSATDQPAADNDPVDIAESLAMADADAPAEITEQAEIPEIEALTTDASETDTPAIEISQDDAPDIAMEAMFADAANRETAEPNVEATDDPLGELAELTEVLNAAGSAEATEAADPEAQASGEEIAVDEVLVDILEEPASNDQPAPVVDTAPIVETAEITDENVPSEDDLEIPEVSFENDVPQPPQFEDLDDEFTKAFNKLTDFDKVTDDISASPGDNAADPAAPQLGEQLDDIFKQISQQNDAEAATVAAAAHAAGSGLSERTEALQTEWEDQLRSDTDGAFSAGPPPVGGDFEQAEGANSSGGGAKRGMMIAAIVAAVAVAGGIGAFGLSFGGGDGEAPPVVVSADDGPVKVKPKDPGGKTVPNEDKKVYEQVAGTNQDDPPTQEKLISTEEEPLDVGSDNAASRVILPGPTDSDLGSDIAALPAENSTLGADNTVADGQDNTGAQAESTGSGQVSGLPAEKNDDRILPEVERVSQAPAEELIAVKPRRVRTLIVKPDGTLVAREEPQPDLRNELRAGTATEDGVATAPADINTGGTDTAGASAAEGSEIAAVSTEAARDVTFQPPTDQEAVVVDGASAAEEEGVAVEGIPVPTPAPRTEFEAQRVAAAAAAESNEAVAATETENVETPAAAEEQSVAAAVPAPPAEDPEWWVQISSQPSREGAQASYAELSNRYSSIIGGRGVNIFKADIEGKGTYYRVRIAGGSRNEAAQLCSRLKSAGAGCFIAR